MVEPYESRRQKKPTGAVKAMPGKNPGPVRPNAAVTPYLGGNTFPLPFSGSAGTPNNYYGMTGRTHPTALGIYPADVATQSAVRTMESSTRVPDKRFPGRWNVPARPGPGGAMPLSAQAEPYTKATTSNPTVLPFQIQTPRPSFLRPTSPWNYVQSPVARPAPQSPSPASVPIDLTSYRPGMASAAPPQPWQVPAPSARTPQSPVQAAAPRPAVYPMYPGSSEWDTAPGWLARAGGVNTSTPEGRMFSAMNRPSVPVAKPAAPTGPSPWDIGTAAMNLGSPEMVKANAMPSPVDPFSVPLTPENFNEVWGARKAQVAASMPALAPRSPVQMPAMPANPSPLGTYANPDRGGYRFGNATTRPYGQSMPTMRPMDPGMRAVAMASAMRHPWQPNISIPGGAEAVARAEAKRQQAATLAQSFERLRERSKAVPFGTYLAGTPETIANLTKNYPWVDPAKTITETMTWDEWLMKNRAQKAAMEQGRPFDLVPVWIGPTGRPRLPSTWDLAKKHKSTRGDGSKVADVIRSRAAERKLKEEPRRAMVTAKAQGRRISPVQAGIEASMAAGSPLSDDQKAMMFGPAFAEIQARQKIAEMQREAAYWSALYGAVTPPEGSPMAPDHYNRIRSMPQPSWLEQTPGQPLPVDPAQADAIAEEVNDKDSFRQRLVAEGVDPVAAQQEADKRFPESTAEPLYIDPPWANNGWMEMLFGTGLPSFLKPLLPQG